MSLSSSSNGNSTHKMVSAGAPGFEPGSTDSKSGVLPLHYAPLFPLRGGCHEFYHMRQRSHNEIVVASSNARQKIMVVDDDTLTAVVTE